MVAVQAKTLEVSSGTATPSPACCRAVGVRATSRFSDAHSLTWPGICPLLQEVEGQYKEGGVKHTLVQVLKAVRPEALTAQGA